MNLFLENGENKDLWRRQVFEFVAVLCSSWQNMAEVDLPCVIDKVLTETGQSKFYLIGHSMGTTVAFAFLSQNHYYDDKVRRNFVLDFPRGLSHSGLWAEI